MHSFALAMVGFAAFGLAATLPHSASAEDKTRVTGPHAHENLVVYFIHGPRKAGPAPLTLQEALQKGSVRVFETGAVNELRIENTGNEDVFIQSGDIVKGGKQDRVLRMSFVLPPKSGEVPLAAFCVESGRWAARGSESVASFLGAAEAMPSREAKLAMRAPLPAAASQTAQGLSQRRARMARVPSDTSQRQQDVWASVANTQSVLSEQLGANVASARSATSLQLSLENKKLKEARKGYLEALRAKGEKDEGIVGYVFAINGRISSADVYPSNALFRKMWPKQLAAGVTEAIGSGEDTSADVPSTESISEFLARAEQGKSQEQHVVNELSHQEVRDTKAALFVEARRSDGSWIHRAYLAK